MKRATLRVFVLSFLTLCAGVVMAQDWPPPTTRIVVPYPPGTDLDTLARDLAQMLAKQTGKVFVVDNRPGANSIVGTSEVLKGDADGSVLLFVDRLSTVINPLLYSNVPYKWEEVLKPISDLAIVRLVIAVREDFPARTYAEFLRYAKENPGKVTVGTGGNGHINHIGMAMVAQANGLSFQYVPYKGVAPATQGLLSKEIDVVMAGGLIFQPHDGKRLRALVVGGDTRAPVLPNVPSVTETGGKSDSIPAGVFTLLAPAKVPDAVVAKIHAALVKALEQPEVKSTWVAKGLDIGTTTPAQTLTLMKQDTARYERIIREAGIKIE